VQGLIVEEALFVHFVFLVISVDLSEINEVPSMGTELSAVHDLLLFLLSTLVPGRLLAFLLIFIDDLDVFFLPSVNPVILLIMPSLKLFHLVV
jgi:hypothetical protein